MTVPRWPMDLLEDGLFRLGGREGLTSSFPIIAGTIRTPRQAQPWLYAAASRAELEIEPVVVRGADLEACLRSSAPLLVVVSLGAIMLERVDGSRATVLETDGRRRRVPLEDVCEAICSLWERNFGLTALDTLVERAAPASDRRASLRSSLRRVQLAGKHIEVGWAVRPAARGASPAARLVDRKQRPVLAKVALAFLGVETATLAGWYVLGRGALTGRFDGGWVVAWALAIVSAAVLQVLSSFWEGLISIAVGARLKKQLLLGALRIDSTEALRDGLGGAMGRVLELETLEELSLTGGFVTLMAGLELFVAMSLLALASTAAFVALFVVFLCLLAACFELHRRTSTWTGARLTMTLDLVERLIGHRTRVAQGDAARVHAEEDVRLCDYAKTSQRLDTFIATVATLLPRGALLLGVVALLPAFVANPGSASLWAGVGAVILAQRALTRLGQGMGTLFEVAAGWKSAGALLRAGAMPEASTTEQGLLASLVKPARGDTVVQMRDVEYSFGSSGRKVLAGASMTLRAGDHVLLEGASGSGKSTFVSVLAGLRTQQSGLVLQSGLDRPALGGAVWRKKVAAAPQQHDNHVLQGSLAFNVLLGRERPPAPQDLVDAETVCREIGLGRLLDRMPSGIMQAVGSSGWRLSHGEQSRVFLARALLQKSDVVVLDESLGALDPRTADQVMVAVRKRAETLIVVAHP